jgi:cytochrome c biogenesis protein
VVDTWNEMGNPIDYTSQIQVYENGKPVKSGDVKVNHPMSYGSATFYQSSFGTTGVFTVRNTNGDIVYSGPTELGLFTARDNPDAPAGFIDIPTEGVRMSVIGPDSNAMNLPELDALQLTAGQMWIGLPGDSEGTVLSQGKPTQVGDYTVTFEREGRYTILQVGYNPGIPIFLIAAGFLVGGLIITFYFPLRRIRGILRNSGDASELHLAPLAKRDYAGKRDFYALLGKLNEKLDNMPSVRAPKNHGDYEYLYKQSRTDSQ